MIYCGLLVTNTITDDKTQRCLYKRSCANNYNCTHTICNYKYNTQISWHIGNLHTGLSNT